MGRILFRSALGLMVCALLASSVWAQDQERGRRGRGGFGGGFGRGGLLTNDQVQKELKLTDDQKEKIQETLRSGREGFDFRGLRELPEDERRAKLDEFRKKAEEARQKSEAVLTPEQAQRLMGITLQVRGNSALSDPEIAKAVNLSEDQVSMLKTINDETSKKRRELFQSGRSQEREERQKLREQMDQLEKDSEAEIQGLLTDDQKAQITKLKGEKFELERRQPRRRNRDRSNDND